MTDLSSGVSLSDRCNIWYVRLSLSLTMLSNETSHKAPKYRCPRCGARTCSAACIKVHKERAMCSGERDRAKYLKKSEIATPEVFDHDFNFISGIERSLENAALNTESRGVQSTE